MGIEAFGADSDVIACINVLSTSPDMRRTGDTNCMVCQRHNSKQDLPLLGRY